MNWERLKYINDELLNKTNKEYGLFFKDYSWNVNGYDYNIKLDLVYNNWVKDIKVNRRNVKNLFNYLNKSAISVDGILVEELMKSGNIHNHLLVYSNSTVGTFKSKVFGYWKNIGSVNCVKYDSEKNGYDYLSKHLGKTQFNNWELISLL